jgi:hypothetical protein
MAKGERMMSWHELTWEQLGQNKGRLDQCDEKTSR